MIEVIIISGAIFCQEIKIPLLNHLDLIITWGNQKWNGAIPDLIKSEIIISILDKKKKLAFIHISHTAMIMIIIEAKACEIKYLIAASA